MKVLIMDRGDDSGIRDMIKKMLDARGHETYNRQTLTTMSDNDDDIKEFLSTIDVAVVHPHWMCLSALEKELRRRDSFRIIMFKQQMPDGEYNSGASVTERRVIYREYLSEENLIKFVEEGWNEYMDQSSLK